MLAIRDACYGMRESFFEFPNLLNSLYQFAFTETDIIGFEIQR